jgi:hypothetical protein
MKTNLNISKLTANGGPDVFGNGWGTADLGATAVGDHFEHIWCLATNNLAGLRTVPG